MSTYHSVRKWMCLNPDDQKVHAARAQSKAAPSQLPLQLCPGCTKQLRRSMAHHTGCAGRRRRQSTDGPRAHLHFIVVLDEECRRWALDQVEHCHFIGRPHKIRQQLQERAATPERRATRKLKACQMHEMHDAESRSTVSSARFAAAESSEQNKNFCQTKRTL